MAETEQESESYRQSTFFSIWLTDEWSQGICLMVESIKCPLLFSVLCFFFVLTLLWQPHLIFRAKKLKKIYLKQNICPLFIFLLYIYIYPFVYISLHVCPLLLQRADVAVV